MDQREQINQTFAPEIQLTAAESRRALEQLGELRHASHTELLAIVLYLLKDETPASVGEFLESNRWRLHRALVLDQDL